MRLELTKELAGYRQKCAVRLLSGLGIASVAVVFALLLTELLLRTGGFLLYRKGPNTLSKFSDSIIFSGDSWTQGAEADPGKSFFDVLRKDPAFKDYFMDNLGYGSYNGLQAVSSLVGVHEIPQVAVINMGVNAWHLRGIEKFLDLAGGYLTPVELAECRREFDYSSCPEWFRGLQLYKLYRHLKASLKRNHSGLDFKALDAQIGSTELYAALLEFWNTGVKDKDFQAQRRELPAFLKEKSNLSLDHKFYLTGLIVGFNSKNMETVLKKAGIFSPNKLTIVPYSVYKELSDLDVGGRNIRDSHDTFIKWSLLLLSRWAERNGVEVFVQTYPDIKKEKMVCCDFAQINALLHLYAERYRLRVIDHNLGATDWRLYRTFWHITSQGHAQMAKNIKAALLPFLIGPLPVD